MQTAKEKLEFRDGYEPLTMESSRDILELIANKYGTDSNPASLYRVAKLLGADLPLIYSIAARRRGIPRSMIGDVASLLGCPPGAVLLVIAAEKEKDPGLKESFLELARRFMPTLGIAVAVAVPMLAHPIARAADCILC